MKYMKLRSFYPFVKGYKRSFTDWSINLRSEHTHTELQYTDRYGGISSSATMRNGADHFRLRDINYTEHPERWHTIHIPVTADQEQKIFEMSCHMADQNPNSVYDAITHGYLEGDWYGRDALKYDKIGVVACNILPMRIIRSRDKYVWCTEGCAMALQAAFPDLLGKYKPDDLTPDLGHKVIGEYFE